MAEKKNNNKFSWGAGDVIITLPNGKRFNPNAVKKTNKTSKPKTSKKGK